VYVGVSGAMQRPLSCRVCGNVKRRQRVTQRSLP
jgi:hypothetical protein